MSVLATGSKFRSRHVFSMIPVGIVNADGRVFHRDSFGVCTVQLNGNPCIIRVRPLRQGIAHQLKLRNCSVTNPTHVRVDLGKFDSIQNIFHGAIRITDSMDDDVVEWHMLGEIKT